MSEDKFNAKVVGTLASRASSMCSNPDCQAITSGPASEDDRAVNVGEAAHIYGGKPGAARYKKDMSDAERSDITNAIWLCRICHKKIDADPTSYPAELLFEWRRLHEDRVLSDLGVASSNLRIKVREKILSEYPEASYIAQQIIIDKPDCWKYKLTAELLKHLLSPLEDRVRNMDEGLYFLLSNYISGEGYKVWLDSLASDLNNQLTAIGNLTNKEMPRAWGEPGESGDARSIYNMCVLLRDACANLIRIEETIRFSIVDSRFEQLHEHLRGTTLPLVKKVFEIAPWMESVLGSEDQSSSGYELELVFTLPDGWSERVAEGLRVAFQ